MGSLIYNISSESAALYGVNILEQAPPGAVQGTGTNVVAVVAELPWGPASGVVDIANNAQLFDQFAPLPFNAGNSYPALKAFINKTFPNLVRIARVAATSAATAAKVFNDAAGSPAPSVDVTARYPGVLGNSVKVAWSTNDDDATARDATVIIGSAYSVKYKAVATIVSAVLVVTDPGDPYVAFTKHSAATLVPAVIAATALTAGADGTAVAGDYAAALERFADASVAWNVGFVAEAPSALIDDINDAIKTFEDTHGLGLWLLSTPASQLYATAKTYVPDFRGGRHTYHWPRVRTINAFDPARAEVTVDGNAFAAAAIASVAPEKSPGGAPGAPFLRGITGIEQAVSAIQLNDLVATGITPWFMSDALEGAIMHNCVLTTLTSGQTRVFRRRMTDFITSSVAAVFERFTGELLDVDIQKRLLGPTTTQEIGQVRQFLADLQTKNRIRGFLLDPFGANVQSNIDAGIWKIRLVVSLFSAQDIILVLSKIGETVEISEEAA